MIRQSDAFFGKNMILGARIAGHVQGEQILVSVSKGLAGTYRVYQVVREYLG